MRKRLVFQASDSTFCIFALKVWLLSCVWLCRQLDKVVCEEPAEELPIYFIWRNFLNNGDSWRCLTFTFNSNLSITFQPQCREKLFEVFVFTPVNSKNEEKTWKNQLEAQLLINGIRAHKGADVSSFCNINNHTFTWSNNVEYTLTGSLMRTICMVESDITWTWSESGQNKKGRGTLVDSNSHLDSWKLCIKFIPYLEKIFRVNTRSRSKIKDQAVIEECVKLYCELCGTPPDKKKGDLR